MKWLYENYKWLFDGVAGAVLLALIGRLLYSLWTRKQLAKWTRKWEQAADTLKKIYPGYVTGPASTTTRNAYALVFNDQLRQRIEHHLGEKTFLSKFRPRNLSKDELLNPAIQEVIGEVLEAVEKFKKEHTDWSRALKLLPPL